jgi:tetratricopeptide (TPR) repeat protein
VSVFRPLVFFLTTVSVALSSAATFEELSARAAAARDANHLPEAVKLYRAALELNPRWQEGWWFLGTILYDTNEYAGCRDAMRHLVTLKADAAPALGILGLCEFQTRDYDQALTHIERSLSLGPPAGREMEKVLRYHEAILLTRAGDYDHAIQKYVWFLGGTPSATLLTAIGVAALRTPLLPGDVPAADRDLYGAAGMAAHAQMSGDRAAAQRAMQALLERFPTAHHVHYLYACSLLAANPEEAIHEFQRELAITPASGGTLAMLAWALLNRGEPAAALPYAEKAVQSEPQYALARYALGRALVETGNVKRGIENLETAAKNDPANLETHLALAAAYPKVRRYDEARRERQKSLELTREAR